VPRLSTADGVAVRAITTEVETVRLSGPPIMDVILPEVRATLGTESMLLYAPIRRDEGWDVERFHMDNCPQPARLKRLFLTYLASSASPSPAYDPVRPEPQQRNRVLEPIAYLERRQPGAFEQSRQCRDFVAPIGLSKHVQLRALVCDGPVLLAWFGLFQPEPVDARQYRVLSAILPSLRRRLSLERRLESLPRISRAFEVLLEKLGAPAFVVGRTGVIYEMNSAGRVLRETRRREIDAALFAVVHHRPSALDFELVPLVDEGGPAFLLAILRTASRDARLAARIATVSARWSLTPRQGAVLGHLVRGLANATIAGELGIGDRAVELHVTALFDRAGVDSRAALVGRVLMED
jgi:DNA-binding CsgD family transcriptional regulator